MGSRNRAAVVVWSPVVIAAAGVAWSLGARALVGRVPLMPTRIDRYAAAHVWLRRPVIRTPLGVRRTISR
jgi:hypothetical protein